MQLGSKQLSSSGDFTEGHTNARTSSKKCEHTWIIEDVHKSVTGVASFLLSDKPDFIMTFLPNGHPSEDPGSVAIMCMLMYNEDVTFRTKISIVDIFGNKSHFKGSYKTILDILQRKLYLLCQLSKLESKVGNRN